MTETPDVALPPGRPVRLVPTPRGFWMTLLGVVTAIFAPLFGFLIGSASGSPDSSELVSPLYWGLFGGVVVGGLGVVAAAIGGRRLWLDAHRADRPESRAGTP